MAVNVDRYTVSSKTLVGQVVPFFLRGRRILRFLAAVCTPLDSVNKSFCEWARDTLVDAAMTSQVVVMKWGLKCKLGKYMLNSADDFYFDTYDRSNYATLYENNAEQDGAPEVKQIYMSENEGEKLGENVARVLIRDRDEITGEGNEILIAAPPHNGRVTDEEYERLIKQCLEKYLVYDVEYKIIISKNSKQ